MVTPMSSSPFHPFVKILTTNTSSLAFSISMLAAVVVVGVAAIGTSSIATDKYSDLVRQVVEKEVDSFESNIIDIDDRISRIEKMMAAPSTEADVDKQSFYILFKLNIELNRELDSLKQENKLLLEKIKKLERSDSP